MKKYMVADLVKDLESEKELALKTRAEELDIPIELLLSYAEELNINPEELDQEDIDNMEEMGPGGFISSSMGDIEFEYDPRNDNYNLTIDFNRGGSAQYVVDADTLFELDSNGGAYYNSSIRGQM